MNRNKKVCIRKLDKSTLMPSVGIFLLVGKRADPSGTAILGQPMNELEQAPELIPLSKISLISKETHGLRIRY